MSERTPEALPGWLPPDWQAEAEDWIRAALEQAGRRLNGPVETLQVRPWSAALVAPVDAGRVYFKACAPHLTNEAALVRALSEWRPDCMPPVLAADPARRWLLLDDAGERLRAQLGADGGGAHWERLLPLFAGVQIEMSARAGELLQLGLDDRRLERLPGMFAELLADEQTLRLGRAGGLSAEQYARLLALQPRYAELCAELRRAPIGETLHHDDFHDGNVLLHDGRYTLIDWGDSGYAHPFFSIIITLRSFSDRLGLPDEATENPDRLHPEPGRLRDRYLETWTDYAPLPELRRLFATAWRVGMVNRALSWRQGLLQMDSAGREQYGHTAPAWLAEFLPAMT